MGHAVGRYDIKKDARARRLWSLQILKTPHASTTGSGHHLPPGPSGFSICSWLAYTKIHGTRRVLECSMCYTPGTYAGSMPGAGRRCGAGRVLPLRTAKSLPSMGMLAVDNRGCVTRFPTDQVFIGHGKCDGRHSPRAASLAGAPGRHWPVGRPGVPGRGRRRIMRALRWEDSGLDEDRLQCQQSTRHRGQWGGGVPSRTTLSCTQEPRNGERSRVSRLNAHASSAAAATMPEPRKKSPRPFGRGTWRMRWHLLE